MSKIKYFLYFLIIISFLNCAGFSPTLVDYRMNYFDAVTEEKDSIVIQYRKLMNKEAELTFDIDLSDEDISIIVFNINNKCKTGLKLLLNENGKIISLDEAITRMQYTPIIYLIGWSLPWTINIAAGLPFYYGIAWPVIGLFILKQANNSNEKIDDFIRRNYLKEEFSSSSVSSGILIVKPREYTNFQLSFEKVDGKLINFNITQTIYD